MKRYQTLLSYSSSILRFWAKVPIHVGHTYQVFWGGGQHWDPPCLKLRQVASVLEVVVVSELVQGDFTRKLLPPSVENGETWATDGYSLHSRLAVEPKKSFLKNSTSRIEMILKHSLLNGLGNGL